MIDSSFEQEVAETVDTYFKKTRDIVRAQGDAIVTYAAFLRRPVVNT